MPTNRFQFSDDFVLKNGKVGINTTEPQEKLDVVGGIVKGQDLKVTGVSSFTTYEGFLNSNQNIIENVSISNGSESGSLSGEIIVGTGITVSVSSGTTSSQGYIDSLKVYNTFTVPTGGTEDRPSKVKPGQLYYNVDFKTIEFWDGNNWRQVDYTTQSGRGVFGGPSTIDFINITSTGNAINFGTLSETRSQLASCSSSTRGLFAGGQAGPLFLNTIDYITIASEGNAIDFGDLNISARRRSGGGCSSSTRGLFAGGYTGTPAVTSFNNIDYVTIATIGNAFDFGDLSVTRSFIGAVSSPTRGVFAGGFSQPSPTNIGWTIIEFVTISSTGNAINFGNLLDLSFGKSGVSNGTRGIFAGGTNPSSIMFNTIEYITIASTGNSQDFGDLSIARTYPGSTSSIVRGVWGGGNTPTDLNTIDYITINTSGNAIDFGDLTSARSTISACSDSHGGLGGF